MRRRSSLIRPGSISVVLCSAFGSRAVCVRRCSHSFQWCLVRLFASIHFISSSSSGCCFFRSFPFIFSFISGTNYFSCFFFFFFHCYSVELVIHTYFICASFFFCCVDSSVCSLSQFFFSLLISRCLTLLLTHNAVMKIHSSTTYSTFEKHDDVDVGCLSPRLKCTHLFVIITIINEWEKKNDEQKERMKKKRWNEMWIAYVRMNGSNIISIFFLLFHALVVSFIVFVW